MVAPERLSYVWKTIVDPDYAAVFQMPHQG